MLFWLLVCGCFSFMCDLELWILCFQNQLGANNFLAHLLTNFFLSSYSYFSVSIFIVFTPQAWETIASKQYVDYVGEICLILTLPKRWFELLALYLCELKLPFHSRDSYIYNLIKKIYFFIFNNSISFSSIEASTTLFL